MKAVVYIVLAAALTYGVSYSLGMLLLRKLQVKLYRSEQHFFAFIAGSALFSTLIFVLTAGGLAYKSVFYGVSVIILAAGVWKWRPNSDSLPPVPRPWSYAFWAIFAAFTFFYLPNALGPEVSADPISYHVALVARYASVHHFPIITNNIYASLTEGIEMLFLYAFTIGKHSAPAMCEFLFLLVLPFGILSYARRIGRPVAGVVAAVLVYASPVFGRVGTIAHNDVAGAAVVFALFYALQIAEPRMVWIAALLAGFAFAVKYTLGIAVVYAVVMVAVRSWRRAVPVAAIAFAMMAPWLIKNAVEVSNPVSPFFNRVFPNPYVSVAFEKEYSAAMSHFNGVAWRDIPMEVTVRGERLQSVLGPVFLLAPLALIALRWPAGRQLLIAAAVFLIPYFGNIGTRFLMPSVPFVALGLGMALELWLPAAVLVIVAHAVLSWPAVIPRYSGQYAWRLEHMNWKAALRRIPESEFLRSVVPDYEMGLILDQKVSPSEPVLSPSMGNQTYHSREILVPYESVFNNQLYDVLFRAVSPGMETTARHWYTFPERRTRHLRLVLDRSGGQWVIGEIRVYSRGHELPRDPRWRLRASVNPWYVQRAFDNSPITVWKSDHEAQRGMYIDIDLGRDEQVDQVAVDSQRDGSPIPMHLDGIDASFRFEETKWPPRMRQAATNELNANGVHWIVIKDGDQLADDLLQRHVQWGIRQEAWSNGFRLWHLR